MAWTDLVIELRWLIGDEISPYDYSDASLQTVLAIAAKRVFADVDTPIDYTVVVSTPSIDPDPSTDGDLANLITLKAACILDGGKARKSAKTDGLAISDDGSSIDTRGKLSALLALLDKGFCNAYEEARTQYIVGNAVPGKVITTPSRIFNRGR